MTEFFKNIFHCCLCYTNYIIQNQKQNRKTQKIEETAKNKKTKINSKLIYVSIKTRRIKIHTYVYASIYRNCSRNNNNKNWKEKLKWKWFEKW